MILNGVMAVILRYFTELVYSVVVKQLPLFQNLVSIVYDYINRICAIIQRLFGQNKLWYCSLMGVGASISVDA